MEQIQKKELHVKKELQVLSETLAELKRFEKRLKSLISECKYGENKHYSKHRGGVKRSAIDLKKQLSEITTATGSYGTYYYEK